MVLDDNDSSKDKKDYIKGWRADNKDKVKGYTSKYRQKNKDKINATHKAWRLKNKDKISEYGRKWRDKKNKKEGRIKMTKDELILELRMIANDEDTEQAHYRADHALLSYINDPDVSRAYDAIDKWYS